MYKFRHVGIVSEWLKLCENITSFNLLFLVVLVLIAPFFCMHSHSLYWMETLTQALDFIHESVGLHWEDLRSFKTNMSFKLLHVWCSILEFSFIHSFWPSMVNNCHNTLHSENRGYKLSNLTLCRLTYVITRTNAYAYILHYKSYF